MVTTKRKKMEQYVFWSQLTRFCRADRPPSCPVLGVFLPRQPVTGEAEDDPERLFATANYRTAKGLFDHLVGDPA